jgi:cbb3-type cytochrome oxidase maturation protein
VDILYVLVPLSVLLMLGILVLFAWALHGGQFDDLEQQGEFILDADEGSTGLDPHQAGRAIDNEQSPRQ